MIAAIVLSNLFYVVGAIVAATVVSAFVLLRHRRPKSLEAGIEMFSRELKALEPERRGPSGAAPGTARVVPTGGPRDGGLRPALRTGGSGGQGPVGRGSRPGARGAGGAGRAGGPDGVGGAVRGRGLAPTPVRQVPLPVRQDQGQEPGRRRPAVTRLESPSGSSGSSAGGFAEEQPTQPTNVVGGAAQDGGRNEARAPSPNQENEPG